MQIELTIFLLGAFQRIIASLTLITKDLNLKVVTYLISREKLLILQKKILFSENHNLQLCPTGNECCAIEDVKVPCQEFEAEGFSCVPKGACNISNRKR